MDVQLPDGTFIQGVPEGTTRAELAAKLQQNGRQVPQHWLELRQPSGDQRTPDGQYLTKNNTLGAQAGLTLRAGIKGVASLPAMMADAATGLYNASADAVGGAMGQERGYRFRQTLPQLDRALTDMGLPEPDTPTQRIVSKGVEVGTGSGATAKAAQMAARVVPEGLRSAFAAAGSNPGTQVVAGAGAGMGGEHAKENGAGFLGQLTSTVLGGLAGAGLATGTSKGGAWLGSKLGGAPSPSVIDQRVFAILENQGVNPRSIDSALLARLRADVGKAMKLGGMLDDAAVGRLTDYVRIGATPTRGAVTLDPFDVTMQRNAEKLAAATGSRTARLPQIAQDNNARLLQTLERMGPSPDAYGAGEQTIRSVATRNAAMEAEKRALYGQARGMAGGDIPLERAPFINAAFEALARENKTAFLPEQIGQMLNQISKGQIVSNGQTYQVPFNVNTLDSLKTMLATASRNTSDGNAKAAIKAVRDALEGVPMSATKPAVPPGSVVTPQMAELMRGGDAAPGTLMEALNRARATAARQFAWQESAPGIERALSGAAPDGFIEANVISKSASFADVARLVKELSPEATQAVRGTIAQHLMEAASGKGRVSGAANFSGVGLQKAIQELGDRKLGLFFSPEEIEALKSAARVGQYETFQPRGSAVNNSNSAAAFARVLQGAKIFPGANALAGPALDRLSLMAAENPTLKVAPGLLAEAAPPGSFSAGLLGGGLLGPATVLSGGLLAPPR